MSIRVLISSWLPCIAAVLVLILVAVLSFLVIGTRTTSVPPKPLFYGSYHADEKGVLPRWHAITPLQDVLGNIAYFDFDCNMIVVIITGNPNHGVYVIPRNASPVGATLLAESNYEVRVNRDADCMKTFSNGVLVNKSILRAGEAESLYHALHADSEKFQGGLFKVSLPLALTLGIAKQ